jgi:anti-anti-sigma regulatory factor
MRLNVESSVVGASTTMLVVSGVIDWSTIDQFRAGLRHVSGPRSAVLVDLTGVLSWSPQAQAALIAAMTRARLQGGRLATFGLAQLPSEQARSTGLYRAIRPVITQAEALAMLTRTTMVGPLSMIGGPRGSRLDAPVDSTARRRRRAEASARWNAQRQHRNRFVCQPGAQPDPRADTVGDRPGALVD